MRQFIKMIIPIFILLILFVYVLAIDAIPTHMTLFQGEDIRLHMLYGMQMNEKINEKTIEAVSNQSKSITEEVGVTKLQLRLLDKIPIKEVNVDILPRTKVIPVGSVAGVKLYTSGVLVVGMSEIEGEDNKIYKPYEKTKIEEGDRIIAVNDVQIASTEDLIIKVNQSNGQDIKLQYVHDQETVQCSITPVKTAKAEYKLGLWVRDSAAGVGTVTFYEPNSGGFAALGHGLVDIDTEKLIEISSGEFVTTNILKIDKGEKGNPGRIQGTLERQQNIGTIVKNTGYGIYGKVNNLSSLPLNQMQEMEVALRSEICLGKAEIMCSLENGKVEKYEIEIEKIFAENNYNNKSMKIKVTDERLIEKTGGIIQGMSGSPIIQNGKLIGAVTHVLVNEPLEGLAVFGDIMIEQLYKSNS